MSGSIVADEDLPEKPKEDDGVPSEETSSIPSGHAGQSHVENGSQHNAQHDDIIIVGWEGNDDPLCPRNLRLMRKWIIVSLTTAASFCVTANASIYTLIYDQVEPELGISREVATLGLTMFVMGLAVGPMFLAPLSEFYGRRPIYLVSYLMVFIWLIPLAVAHDIATILVARFFGGVFGSAFLSVSGGAVGDMFDKKELTVPLMMWSGSILLGSTFAPVLGGLIVWNLNWRWTFWIMLIWTGVQGAFLLVLVPETYHPVLLRSKARRLRSETNNSAYQAPIERTNKSILQTVLWSCIRPFQLLVLEPMLFLLCLLSALLLGILYLFFGAFPLVFQTNYDFNIWQVGLSYLGLSVGMVLGICSGPIWQRTWNHLVQQREGVTGESGISEPEFRLPPTVLGAVLVPVGLFTFAWTSYPSIHWAASIVLSGIFGAGVVLAYSGIFTWTVEVYPVYAASALGANAIIRSVFAAVFPLFGVQMYEVLGFRWASSLLGFLALALMPFPYLFYIYGKRLRSRSKFASAKPPA